VLNIKIFKNYFIQLINDLKIFFSKKFFQEKKKTIIFYMISDPNTSYNADDFLLEIEHLNTQINNREKQMQSDTFKVC
jgi:hypothetical protein